MDNFSSKSARKICDFVKEKEMDIFFTVWIFVWSNRREVYYLYSSKKVEVMENGLWICSLLNE